MTKSYNKFMRDLEEVKDALVAAQKGCSEENKASYDTAVNALNEAINSLEKTASKGYSSSSGLGFGSSANDDDVMDSEE